jgi:hypothetical protein
MRDDVIPPPSCVTVDHEHRLVLFRADGRALVRSAGFVPGGRMAIQTSGVAPKLNVKPKAKGGTSK